MGYLSNTCIDRVEHQSIGHLCEMEDPSPETVVNGAVSVEGVSCWYGTHQVVNDVSLIAERNQVTALIGPSGCGKSTLLRSLNRMNDRIPGFRIKGSVRVGQQDIYDKKRELTSLRRKIGMVFQKPNPFPGTIYENVALAPRVHYGLSRVDLDNLVEESLERAALWSEVKDVYRKRSAMALSGGQQQRLCIARTLAVGPEVLLMDEPCSALDPASTFRIEQLIHDLAPQLTIIVVTHNLQQAGRISHKTAFMLEGELIEVGETVKIFENPSKQETADFVTGRFG